ncbi:MAG: hypothetical protein AB9856_02990 [Cellulosilyticaceae bacterium]
MNKSEKENSQYKYINVKHCLLSNIHETILEYGDFVDEFNTSPDAVAGGALWLYMDWLRLGFTALLCILASINLFNKK